MGSSSNFVGPLPAQPSAANNAVTPIVLPYGGVLSPDKIKLLQEIGQIYQTADQFELDFSGMITRDQKKAQATRSQNILLGEFARELQQYHAIIQFTEGQLSKPGTTLQSDQLERFFADKAAYTQSRAARIEDVSRLQYQVLSGKGAFASQQPLPAIPAIPDRYRQIRRPDLDSPLMTPLQKEIYNGARFVVNYDNPFVRPMPWDGLKFDRTPEMNQRRDQHFRQTIVEDADRAIPTFKPDGEGMMFERVNASGLKVHDRSFYGAGFKQTDLSNAAITACTFDGARFYPATRLDNWNGGVEGPTRNSFQSADIENISARNARFVEDDFSPLIPQGVDADRALQPGDWSFRVVRNNREQIDFVKKTIIEQSDFTGAQFRGCDMQHLFITKSNFTGTVFAPTTQAANLYGMSATETTFDSATFFAVFAPNARFDNSSFKGARLDQADMPMTSFRGVDFQQAEIVKCDLRGCDFRGARLAGVKAFEGNDLTGALYDDATTLPGLNPASFASPAAYQAARAQMAERLGMIHEKQQIMIQYAALAKAEVDTIHQQFLKIPHPSQIGFIVRNVDRAQEYMNTDRSYNNVSASFIPAKQLARRLEILAAKGFTDSTAAEYDKTYRELFGYSPGERIPQDLILKAAQEELAEQQGKKPGTKARTELSETLKKNVDGNSALGKSVHAVKMYFENKEDWVNIATIPVSGGAFILGSLLSGGNILVGSAAAGGTTAWVRGSQLKPDGTSYSTQELVLIGVVDTAGNLVGAKAGNYLGKVITGEAKAATGVVSTQALTKSYSSVVLKRGAPFAVKKGASFGTKSVMSEATEVDSAALARRIYSVGDNDTPVVVPALTRPKAMKTPPKPVVKWVETDDNPGK